MSDFYMLSTMKADLAKKQARLAAIPGIEAELDAEEVVLNTEITALQNLIAYIEGGFAHGVTALDAPANLVIVSGIEEAALQWDDVANADGYKVERDLNPEFDNPVEVYDDVTSEYTDTGLDTGVTYYYRVKAYGAGYGDSEWSEENVIILEKLDTPTNFALTPGDTEISGQWDFTPFATTYDVWRHTADDFGAATLINDGIADNFFTHTGLVNGTTYYFWVIAKADLYLDSDAATGNDAPVAP